MHVFCYTLNHQLLRICWGQGTQPEQQPQAKPFILIMVIESIISFYRLKKKRLRVRKVQFFAQWKEVVWGLFWVIVMLELTYPKEVHPLIVVLNDLFYLLSTLKIISPPTSPDLVWSLWAFLDFWNLCLENPLPESPHAISTLRTSGVAWIFPQAAQQAGMPISQTVGSMAHFFWYTLARAQVLIIPLAVFSRNNVHTERQAEHMITPVTHAPPYRKSPHHITLRMGDWGRGDRVAAA